MCGFVRWVVGAQGGLGLLGGLGGLGRTDFIIKPRRGGINLEEGIGILLFPRRKTLFHKPFDFFCRTLLEKIHQALHIHSIDKFIKVFLIRWSWNISISHSKETTERHELVQSFIRSSVFIYVFSHNSKMPDVLYRYIDGSFVKHSNVPLFESMGTVFANEARDLSIQFTHHFRYPFHALCIKQVMCMVWHYNGKHYPNTMFYTQAAKQIMSIPCRLHIIQVLSVAAPLHHVEKTTILLYPSPFRCF